MEKYSVLTYIIGDYELVHEIKEKSENAEYILVTDNPAIKSETWNVVLDESLKGGTTWEKCYSIRFNPFKYCNTDICLRIDGSMEINSSLDPIIQKFNKDNYDMCFCVHPGRNTMIQEYQAWVSTRNYPMEQAGKCLNYLTKEGYDIRNYQHLQQMNFQICRNNRKGRDFHTLVFAILQYLGDDNNRIERLDQTISSFVLAKYFSDLNIMWVDQRLMQSKYFNWFQHGTNIPFKPMKTDELIKAYAFNKRIQTVTKELLDI